MIRLFSYEQAASEYGLPIDMIREAVASGALKAIKRGNNFIRLTEHELDRWIKSQEKVC